MLSRPYIFRDPVHGDIAFPRDGLHEVIQQIVDEEIFQRLRGIKQNGVLNLVFHGAEHSRFTHSIGAAHLAGRMYDAACNNSGLRPNTKERELTVLAALLHDVGHGPFSHLIEEILGKKHFHHEKLTARILTEKGSPIFEHLSNRDPALPKDLLAFIDYKERKPRRWYHAIVSSQLDADRLDYTARDAMMAGVLSHRFDRDRLIGSLYVWRKAGPPDDEYLAVDDRARDVVENYLLALYHLYRSIYYHHTVRAASWLLNAVLARARELSKTPDWRERLFPEHDGKKDPLWSLIESGSGVPLDDYGRLDEAHVWGLVQRWRTVGDPTLTDLCDRLKQRKFFKAMDLPPSEGYDELKEIESEALNLVREAHPGLEPQHYVRLDQTSRKGYKPYKWGKEESGAESIFLVSKSGEFRPIEQDSKGMLDLLDEGFKISRLIVPEDVRTRLQAARKRG